MLNSISEDNEKLEAIYPLYDTIPYSDPAEIQTKGGQTVQAQKRAHIYDKITYEDAQQSSTSRLNDTAADSKNVIETSTVPKDEKNDDKW